ncbi:ABC transporter substrate-binding protein [Nocardiopsis potens]|uniref:ABC transporter substrate-binding protein n=1 Tax=Nocardiopsis potens TaxID=1246458 RepID=UPI000348EED3|nr:spermidine/putrescine ABC transporter substrate-binding protein [Nocardiopsis potens]
MSRTDPALLRGLTRTRPSRRTVLGASALAMVLSACGVRGQAAEELSGADFWEGKESSGKLSFANWPLYMDAERTQLKEFTEATGIEVDYDEAVAENKSFFGKVRPKLADGDSIGYDLMVLSTGVELTELMALNYLAPLDHMKMPNFDAYAGQRYKNATYDQGNRFTVPYASGITGIAYNPKYVDREITGIADLWDPEFKGKVGMMADAQEASNFALLLDGVEPGGSGKKDWEKAVSRLEEQREAGIVRRYYEQDYIQPLTNGDLWISMAWSGDVFQQNAEEGTELEFIVPEEGGTLWSDLMMIPYTAKNPVDAIMLMDFLYEPRIAAGLTEYINFIPPVPEAHQEIKEKAEAASGDEKEALEELADSPLVFPSDEDYTRLHDYVPLGAAELKEFTSMFLAVTQA